MTYEDKKLLTEYLGERWRDKTVEDVFEWQDNRTFTTRADMMDLYEAIAKKGKWGEFFHHAKDPFELVALCPDESGTGYDCYESDFATWLFCLDGQGYDERCQMVAEWLKENQKIT